MSNCLVDRPVRRGVPDGFERFVYEDQFAQARIREGNMRQPDGAFGFTAPARLFDDDHPVIVVVIGDEGQPVLSFMYVFIGNAAVEQSLIEGDHFVVVFIREDMGVMHLPRRRHLGHGAGRIAAMRRDRFQAIGIFRTGGHCRSLSPGISDP